VGLKPTLIRKTKVIDPKGKGIYFLAFSKALGFHSRLFKATTFFGRLLRCRFRGLVCLLLAAAVDAGGGMVAGDDSVADGDDAMGVLGDIGLVGDDDDGVAVGVKLVE
jgi:hypothetical protein